MGDFYEQGLSTACENMGLPGTLEKLCSTREMHERAHIHHAITITLMRRACLLLGLESLLETP